MARDEVEQRGRRSGVKGNKGENKKGDASRDRSEGGAWGREGDVMKE